MNQNEPIFQNLYMRDTEKPKTFVQSTTQEIMYEKNSKTMLIFVE
jgi:hypothetical protein